MKLENQCCTMEQAKKLKELGIRGVSAFQSNDDGVIHMAPMKYQRWNVAELGVMLPSATAGKLLHMSKCGRIDGKGDNFDVQYGSGGGTLRGSSFSTEAESRAYILIWLLENGHVTAAEVNARLTNS